MNITYTLKEGLLGFRRARLSMTISIMTIAISLFLLGLFALIYRNMNTIMQSFRDRIEMEAFLDESIGDQDYRGIEKRILAVAGVQGAAYISKQEAAEIFRKEFGEDINKVLDFNPLPASYKITLDPEYRNPDSARSIHRRLASIPGVDDIIYRRTLLELIEKRSRIFMLGSLLIGVMLTTGAVFLVSNTIRLAIFSRRKIIDTMRLVGATQMFVRMPFVIEGLVQGIAGGSISALLLYGLLALASRFLGPDLSDFVLVEPTFYAIVVGTGLLLGLAGSLISIRKFLGGNVAR
jgi:cell division transport system permease protein